MIVKLGWHWSAQSLWQKGAYYRIEGGILHEVLTPPSQLQVDVDWSDKVVLPGFINSHCHLELSALLGQIPSGQNFSTWVGQLQSLVSLWDDSRWRDSYEMGLDYSIRQGTTRILDVGNRDWSSYLKSSTHPLASQVTFQKELIGINPNRLTEIQEQQVEYVKLLKDPDHFRLIPHAPFSCSKELVEWILSQTDWFNVHISESQDEYDFFNSQAGPLFEFVRMIYPEYYSDLSQSSFDQVVGQWFASKTPAQVLLTHANTLTTSELDEVIERKWGVVHCPSSRQYFEHSQNDWEAYIQKGGQICLGTDSLASTHSLSLWDEIRLFNSSFPTLSESQLLTMVTSGAADLIDISQEGLIQDGHQANLQVLSSWVNNSSEPEFKDVNFSPNIEEVMIRGERYEPK